MPKYVIERNMAGAGALERAAIVEAARTSCRVLHDMGPTIQWLHSYVTDDKLYCIYIAPDADAVRQHAERGGFPADRVSEVKSIIDPTTAEG